jgi:hypothetical protein
MSSEGGEPQEQRGLVSRVGPLEVDWPRTVGYFGGIGLAVAYDLIAPPLAIFVAAIPFLKLLKHPHQPMLVRVVADTLEGAAKPVGGDTEATVRVAAKSASQPGAPSAPRAPRSRRSPAHRRAALSS